ncbi:MAG TPA: serine hydrolase domain-containing protein [Parafilimonas sp.]|nr:serine hydrolase domain-containing protein [Parafilimonas sp.]
MKFLRRSFILLLISNTSFAQTWQDTLSLTDKALSQYQPANPGCQLSVSRNGQVIFSKAWGMADMERNIPLSTNSILEGGSVSKQFTAAAILLLEQQGKLSLDDDVRKYIPELPDYGTHIKLRQMMHHASGLRDWGSVAELTGWPRSRKFYSNDDALEIIARQQHLNNKPGDEYIYSNSNYNLFAIIVQRVSGLSLAAFTRKYIFEPAGMVHTQWRDDPNRIVPDRAIAYSKQDSSFIINMPNEYVYGNGGLLTTTEDLLKWSDFYQGGKLGTGSLLSKQVQTDPLNNGVMNPYGAGLVIRKVMGWNNISHSGATAGYRAYLETFPELNLTIAMLSNTSQFNIAEVESRVRKIFLPDKSEPAAGNKSSMHLSEAALKSFAGMYVNERDHSTFQISVKDSLLMVDSDLPLFTISNNSFKGSGIIFQINGDKGMYITASPVDTIRFTKAKLAVPSPKELNTYAGDYFSEETNSNIVIQNKNGTLIFHIKPGQDYPLIPTYADAFKSSDLDGDLVFTRNVQNKIIAFKISVSRARNVEFKKLK